METIGHPEKELICQKVLGIDLGTKISPSDGCSKGVDGGGRSPSRVGAASRASNSRSLGLVVASRYSVWLATTRIRMRTQPGQATSIFSQGSTTKFAQDYTHHR